MNALINRWALNRTRLSRMQDTIHNPDNATIAHYTNQDTTAENEIMLRYVVPNSRAQGAC